MRCFQCQKFCGEIKKKYQSSILRDNGSAFIGTVYNKPRYNMDLDVTLHVVAPKKILPRN